MSDASANVTCVYVHIYHRSKREAIIPDIVRESGHNTKFREGEKEKERERGGGERERGREREREREGREREREGGLNFYSLFYCSL